MTYFRKNSSIESEWQLIFMQMISVQYKPTNYLFHLPCDPKVICSQGGGVHPPRQTPPPDRTSPPSRADTHLMGRHPPWQTHLMGRHNPPRQMNTAADGTHPTGIHSCVSYLYM